jgi:lysylphosphatidylglycerol synthetase-like protein (DUF2156 family)
MKKTGVYFLIAGIILSVVFIFFITSLNSKIAWYYFALFAGLISFFLGISFLFYDQPIEKRKKTAQLFLCTGIALIVVVFILKKLHWPGTGILVSLISCFLSFTYLPLLTKNRVEKWKQFTRKKWHAYFLSVGDLVSFAALILGYLFKLLHWPGAEQMMITGLIILAAGIVGWNRLFSKEIVLRKEAEEKVKEAFEELKKQHEVIEEKNREILDSLRYAKRIQQALLPTDKYIDKRLKDLPDKKSSEVK